MTARTCLSDIRAIVSAGVFDAAVAVHRSAVLTYWRVGRRIVEEEQGGRKRAEYGSSLLDFLSAELSAEFGAGYTARDLRQYRQCFLYFKELEIWYSRVPNLTWTHFRSCLSETDETARLWYLLDEFKRTDGDNPTVGIVLCAETDEDIARYSVLHGNKRLFAAKYMTVLPTPELLRDEVLRQKEIFYAQHPSALPAPPRRKIGFAEDRR